jgi:hypothetical protein
MRTLSTALFGLFLLACKTSAPPRVEAQSATASPPCAASGSISAAGTSSANFDNRVVQCNAWQLNYSTSGGTSALLMWFESAPDNAGTPGTFSAVTPSSKGQPLTATGTQTVSFQPSPTKGWYRVRVQTLNAGTVTWNLTGSGSPLSLPATSNGFYYPQMWGAQCKAGVDDTEAFNRAEASLYYLAPGNTLELMPGSSCYVSCVRIQPAVTFDGKSGQVHGSFPCTSGGTGVFYSPIYAQGALQPGQVIRDVYIACDNKATGIAGVALNGGEQNGRLENIQIQYCAGSGVTIKNTNGFVVDKVSVVGSGPNGFNIYQSYVVSLLDCDVEATISAPSVPATGPLLYLNGTDIKIYRLHTETDAPGIGMIQLDSAYDTAIVSYNAYVFGVTIPWIVELTGNAYDANLFDLYGWNASGTSTVTNIVYDPMYGYTVAGNSSSVYGRLFQLPEYFHPPFTPNVARGHKPPQGIPVQPPPLRRFPPFGNR